jgi:hypothetical protein
MRIGVFASCLLLAACTSSGGDDQGDDQGDDGDDTSDECSETADDCTGDNICIGGSCEAAFGRLYDVTDVNISLPTTDPDGAAWDAGGGAPDILIDVSSNGVHAPVSATVDDVFDAYFPGPFTVTIAGGADLTLEIYDEDLTVNDFAGGCAADPITADLLRSRLLSCPGVSFLIVPR